MRLNHLNEIVKSIHADLTCPRCRAKFAVGAFDVVDIIGDRGIFAAHCGRCNTSTMIVSSVREYRQRVTRHDEQVAKVATDKISPADVVDMKAFLDNFGGDFKKTFEAGKKINQPQTSENPQDFPMA